MKCIGKTASRVADRLLAPFLLATFLAVPVCYHLTAGGPGTDTSLRNAIEEGRDDRVDAASLGALNAPDASGMTPLMVASMLGRTDMVERLLARGADVNTFDPRLGTALIFAAHFGHAQAVATLLRHGASPSPVTALGSDALWCAIIGGDSDCVAALLRAGADLSAPRKYGLLGGVTSTGDRADLVRLLVAAGARPNQPGPDGVPPLLDVAEHDAPDCVVTLLQLGADPAARDRQGRTARDVAASYGHADIVRILDQYTSRPKP